MISPIVTRKLTFLLPFLLFGALSVYFAAGLGRDPHVLPSVLIDKLVPPFELPPLPGFMHGLSASDLATGEPQLLNVFASWCAPCRAEQPVLMQIVREQGVSLRGLNYKDKSEDALEWLHSQGDPFRSIGTDRDGRVAIDFGVYGVPETFVIDGKGHIRYKHVGPLTLDEAEKTILPKLKALR
ncbi:MAG: DsbE family thiol:disulfide interchange protein [Rhodospirillaceae bacterium]